MPCQLAITSVSLGRGTAGHEFVHKMSMAQKYGYKGVELFHDDLASIARMMPGGLTNANEIEAARIIHRVCRQRGIQVICLQPFWHYEGLSDRSKHLEHVEKLFFWFKLARVLGTDMIQIPSNFLPKSQLSSDPRLAIQDLQKVADFGLLQEPPIRFVYEALAWGTRCDTWEQSWKIVQQVDRPNFGLCLDTFNIAARVWADPTGPTGRSKDSDELLAQSLARMADTVDVSKVFCVQVVDAERLASPLLPGHEFHDEAQPPRMSWSRNCRLFYGESDRGAHLPVEQIARVIFEDVGYQGWVSMELFHRRMADEDAAVPRELAARGAVAWKKLIRDVGVKVALAPTRHVASEKRRTWSRPQFLRPQRPRIWSQFTAALAPTEKPLQLYHGRGEAEEDCCGKSRRCQHQHTLASLAGSIKFENATARSGKTAFLSAVLGLVEYNGRNTIDDTDVRELPDVFVQQRIVSVSPLPARVSGHAAPEPRPPLYGKRAQNCLPDDIVVEVLKKLILWREVVARGAILDSPMSAMGLSRDQREVLSIARAILRQKHLSAKIVMVGGTLSTVDQTLDLLASRRVPRMHPQQGDTSPRDALRRFTGNQASQRLY